MAPRWITPEPGLLWERSPDREYSREQVFGCFNKGWLQGERRDHYAAEGNFWKMISRVFNERERVEVLDAIDLMEDAVQFLKEKAKQPEDRGRAQFQEERIRELLDLARLGKQLLDALVKDAKVDGSPLMNVLLGGADKR